MTARRVLPRPALRALALLLLVTGWGVPLAFPHLAEDDLLCALGEAADGRGDARLEGHGPDGPADHCAVCHSLRSFRTAGLYAQLASTVMVSARLSPVIDTAGRTGVVDHRLPARAPPV